MTAATGAPKCWLCGQTSYRSRLVPDPHTKIPSYHLFYVPIAPAQHTGWPECSECTDDLAHPRTWRSKATPEELGAKRAYDKRRGERLRRQRANQAQLGQQDSPTGETVTL